MSDYAPCFYCNTPGNPGDCCQAAIDIRAARKIRDAALAYACAWGEFSPVGKYDEGSECMTAWATLVEALKADPETRPALEAAGLRRAGRA